MSAWIRMLGDSEAPPALADAFERVRSPAGTVDNVMRVHSLRPATMLGHHALYMSVLHDEANVLPGWFLESVASYTSILNRCHYSLTNHWSNARFLIADEARARRIREALEADAPERAFRGKELAMLRYARKLTLSPGEMREADLREMKDEGAEDGEILEINQVCAYFNYVNRALNGLGVTLAGDVIGYYAGPPSGPDD